MLICVHYPQSQLVTISRLVYRPHNDDVSVIIFLSHHSTSEVTKDIAYAGRIISRDAHLVAIDNEVVKQETSMIIFCSLI